MPSVESPKKWSVAWPTKPALWVMAVAEIIASDFSAIEMKAHQNIQAFGCFKDLLEELGLVQDVPLQVEQLAVLQPVFRQLTDVT